MNKFTKIIKVVFALLLVSQLIVGHITSEAVEKEFHVEDSNSEQGSLEVDNDPSTQEDEMNDDTTEIHNDIEKDVEDTEIEIDLEEAIDIWEDAVYSDGYIIYGVNGLTARNAQSATVRIRGRISGTMYDFSHIVNGFSNRNANIAILEARVGNSGPWLTAFCVEVAARYPTEDTGMTEGAPLTAAQRQNINRVLMYGYGNLFGYNANEQVSDDAYVVTQVAIWEIITAAGNFTGTGNPSGDIWRRLVANTGSTSNGWSAGGNSRRMGMYNRMREDFRNHSTIPSFMNTNASQSQNAAHILRWNTSNNRYQVTLNDSNGVLSRYFTGNSGNIGGYNIERSGNSLTISTTNANTNTYTFPSETFRKVGSGTSTIFWVHPTLQNAVTGGAGDPVTAFLSVVVEQNVGQIHIQKREGTTNGSAIPNTQFEVQFHNGTDWVNHGTFTTDANGNVALPNLLPGRYRIREIFVPNPYILQSDWREVTINNTGNTVTETFVNQRATGSIEITKNSSSGGVVPGTEFRIVGNGIDRVVVTGENGSVTVNNLPLSNEETTEYTVTEIKVPAPYLIDATPRIVTLSRSQSTASLATSSISFTNERAQGQIEIIKYSETGALLPNTTFDIFDNETEAFIERLTTGENGRVQSSLLDLGTYVIKEVSVPGAHVLGDPIVVTLEYKDEVTPVVVHTEEIVNTLIRGGFELVKLSENSNVNFFQRIIDLLNNRSSQTLENVEFELWSLNEEEPELLEVLRTDGNGRIFKDGLLHGDYKLVETVTGDSHQLLEEPIYFEIREHNVILEFEVINNLTRTEILKVNENGDPLAGATLQIIDASNEVVEEWISTESAHQIKGLAHGTYTLREIKAPSRYVLMEDIEFTVTNQASPIVLTATNALTQTEILKVDENEVPLAGATLQIINANNEVVEEWISTNNSHQISGLEHGSYILREVKAPSGYVIMEDIRFTVTDAKQSLVLHAKNNVTRLDILKVNERGNALAGATLQVLNSQNELIEEWISTESAHEIVGLAHGSYILREVKAPTGYMVMEDIPFTVTDAKETIVLTARNELTQTEILKVNENGDPLAGATLQIVDASNEVVEEWVSTDKAHTIAGLEHGSSIY